MNPTKCVRITENRVADCGKPLLKQEKAKKVGKKQERSRKEAENSRNDKKKKLKIRGKTKNQKPKKKLKKSEA